jgi:hypothetical protein
MSEEKPLNNPTSISDVKLKSLWKQAVTASLSPENDHPAYKLYYIFLRKEIIEKYCKNQKELELLEKND